jgi:mono/diheme cytochrome c family protein
MTVAQRVGRPPAAARARPGPFQLGLGLAGWLLAGCSLAGDVTPPPALATAQMAQPPATQPLASQPPATLRPPSGPADLDSGRLIYLERCAGCHGPNGLGDGELAADLQFPPAPLGQADFARQAPPSRWYSAVTLGNLERFMPPFASLSDGERWAVTGYALSLSVSDQQLQQGEALYQAECAGCHGPEGPGPDLTPGRRLVDRSAADLFQAVSLGAGADMPGFADRLTEDQRWAVAVFLQRRDLTAGAGQPERVEQPAFSAVRGSIRNGTAGGAVPAGLSVELHGFDGELEVLTQTTLADGEGRFSFEGLEAVPGRLYYVSLEYQGLPYRSEIAHLLPDQEWLELPLTVYEPSSAIEALSIARLHLLIDFPVAGTARVLQLWALDNPTDRVITNPAGVLQIRLPAGAVDLQFDELDPGGRFRQTPSGYTDTAPVLPGVAAGDLSFGFDLPFEGRLEYEQRVEHPVKAVVILMVPDGPRLSGAGLQDMGVLDMGGVDMQAYTMGGLAAGETLSFRISPAGGLASGQGLGLLIGGASLGAALVLAGLWWYRSPRPGGGRSPQRGAQAADAEGILAAIARLDDEFEAGQIPQAEYLERREQLKRRALEAMGSERD